MRMAASTSSTRQRGPSSTVSRPTGRHEKSYSTPTASGSCRTRTAGWISSSRALSFVPMTGKASEVRAWYNTLYASVGLSSTRPVEAYPQFLDLLDVRPGTALLDVSCGQGFLLKAAVDRGLEAFGVDISDQAIRLA